MRIDVVILAGGKGTRTGYKTPKQFIEVDGKPIIIRTLENFQINPRINNITVVCLKEHIDELWSIIKKFNITKVNNIIEGGETGHDSSSNGVLSLSNTLKDDDFVIIHDAVRPILPQAILNQMIDTALKRGNACLALPCYETVILTEDGIKGNKEIDRNSFLRVQTPQMYRYGLIKSLYLKAKEDNLHNFVYANTLAIHYGVDIYFSKGFLYNLKITTQDDFPAYRLLTRASEELILKK